MIELDLVYKEHLYRQQQARKDNQEKMYHYYTGEASEILKYLDIALLKTFDSLDLQEFQKDYLNITKKIIHETSVIYTEPPERKLVNKDGEENEDLTKYFDTILTGRLNSKDKKIHRFGKLFNTAIMEVFFNKLTKKIDFRIDSPHLLTIIPHENDYMKIGVLMYDKYFKNGQNKDELYTVVWTEKEHFKVDASGNKSAIGDNEKMVNDYGIIPFVVYRTEEMGDFWGVGQDDIVNTNEVINVFLTDLVNGTLMSVWGTPLFVNCDLEKKASDKDNQDVKKVRVGIKHPIIVEDVRTDQVAPRLEYISHNAVINDLIGEIDWRIKLLAANKGIDPNVFLQEAKATSGFSKVMDRINQIEIRNDDIEPAREFEEERFEIIKRLNNYYVNEIEGGQEIPNDVKLKVDFAEVNIPKSDDEIWKNREMESKYGMSTPKDWLKEDNPDLTDEEAEEILSKNKSIMNDIINAPTKTNFQKLLENPINQQDNNNINV